MNYKKVLWTPHGVRLTIESDREISKESIRDLFEAGIKAFDSDNLFLEVDTIKRFTNLIVIDASGSMDSKATEVKGGLKQIFKDIKDEATKNPNVITTTIVIDFSNSGDTRELINTTNSNELTDKIAESYATRGMTALYDAIGFAFSKVPTNQDGVFVTILTDGEENDSKETKSEDVKKLIQKSKDDKWVVTFMGTTEKCLDQAISLGISRGNTMAFMDSGEGVGYTLTMANASRSAYYTSTTSLSGNAAFDFDNAFTSTSNVTGSEPTIDNISTTGSVSFDGGDFGGSGAGGDF